MSHWLNSVLQLGPQLCARAIPVSPYSPLYGALVCGIDLPAGRDRALFLDTGLIHILVVSGAHLLFLERLCTVVPERVRLVFLAGYCWLTGFGAPVLRAFVRRLCSWRLHKQGWSELQIEALASFVILVILPQWILSRSFLMSWLCALALHAPIPEVRPPVLNLSLKCYVFLYPFALASPVTVAWNCALAPLIGQGLFPACLLAFAVPWAVPFCDWMWMGLLAVLEAGPRAPSSFVFLPTAHLVAIPFVVHGLLLWGEWKWRRAVAFLS